jgi:hypothetical protein
MKSPEKAIRNQFARLKISDDEIVKRGGKFELGWYEMPDDAHKAMMREFSVKSRQFGLGDAVASIAQPIAKAIDSIAGTNIEGCGGCQQRKEALNKLVPNL